MKKYKTALTILLVFLCVLAAPTVYSVINNINGIIFYKNLQKQFPDIYSDKMTTQQFTLYAISITVNCTIIGFAIFGIVILAKILKDKQLFTTPDEQPATPNND